MKIKSLITNGFLGLLLCSSTSASALVYTYDFTTPTGFQIYGGTAGPVNGVSVNVQSFAGNGSSGTVTGSGIATFQVGSGSNPFGLAPYYINPTPFTFLQFDLSQFINYAATAESLTIGAAQAGSQWAVYQSNTSGIFNTANLLTSGSSASINQVQTINLSLSSVSLNNMPFIDLFFPQTNDCTHYPAVCEVTANLKVTASSTQVALPTPEPMTVLLLGTGLAMGAVATATRRRKVTVS